MAAEQCGTSVAETTLCFFGLHDGIHSYKDLVGLAALTVILLTFAFNLIRTANAFLLVKRMNPGASRGSALAALLTLVEIVLRHPLAFFSPAWNIFVRMRMRVEHEVFDPRPEWEWPVAGTDSRSTPGYWREFGRFLAERGRWHVRMMRIGRLQSIRVETAGDLNGKLGEIQRYFETIRSLRFADRDELSFLCALEIEQGFVAPLHLLTGLLAQYNEKWDGIIEEFQRQTSRWGDIPLIEADDGTGRMTAQDFRQIQSFIYHCWLLWGPSVPICLPKCGNWAGSYLSIQYGYGDENNSIELVGDRKMLVDAVNGMVSSYFPDLGGMAFPASVTGVLQYSTMVRRNPSLIPPLIDASWGGEQDARPVLFLSEQQEGDALTGSRKVGSATVGAIQPEMRGRRREGASRYYSAYLWAMFVVLRNDGTERPLPIDADPGANPMEATSPWQTTIPFFEHGNIADGESCEFAKQVLADKVLSAIVQFTANWKDLEGFPLRFAYASAIDDSNCGAEPLFPHLRGGTTIRELIEKRLKDAPPGGMLGKLRRARIIRFDYYKKQAHQHPHSACSLPFHIADYYAAFGDEAADQSESAPRRLDGVESSRSEAESRLVSAESSEEGSIREIEPPE
ncbi:hypothetical protein [Sphingomonas sp.]|uniref:hypothetical protein n=1 Tax=Sphingomonas sp. TaxID=28214 RepID=UPI001B0776D0|nr:hypothetical protein [Sphingomonas sp.]